MAGSKTGDSLWGNLFRKDDPWQETVAGLWAATPLFRKIPKKEIIKLARYMHPRQYKAGEPVFKANDQGAGAALILKGRVEIRSGSVILASLENGDFFGEISLVLDERRTADAVALEDTDLAFFLRLDLEEWIERSPQHGARLGTNLAHILARRLQHANELLAEKGVEA